jgi:4-diphosphocytidyl-2-C-methyl-D-erythritol kinase
MNGIGIRGVPPVRVALRTPAKVNLHLEVLRLREDGYHEIETVLQAVNLFDEVTVELRERRAGEPRIDLAVEPFGSAPENPTNLGWRAAQLFCARTGRSGHLRIDLRKSIPARAGLGGGSSDAAAVLVGCDRLFDTHLEAAELEALGAEIGSDVPFFIRGGTQVARGRGTELTPVAAPKRGLFLIFKPAIDLSTSDVYAGLNMGLTSRSPRVNISNIEALIARFPTGSWFGTNRLEDVVLPSYPVLQRLVQELRERAPVAMLSGSGAAVFAVFDDEQLRDRTRSELAQPEWFVRTASAFPGGVTAKEGGA